MAETVLSIIVPFVSDKTKVVRFCNSAFSADVNIEMFFCESVNKDSFDEISLENAEKIKIYPGEDNYRSFCSALKVCEGEYIMLADVNVTFPKGALETLCQNAEESAVACNCGIMETGIAEKAFSENFSLNEMSEKSIFSNHILRKCVIEENNMIPANVTPFSLMNFIADYYRYDRCLLLHDVLIYTDFIPVSEPETRDWITLPEYGYVFGKTCNDMASMLFLRNVFTEYLKFDDEKQREFFDYIKGCASNFLPSYSICSWVKVAFLIDIELLSDENSTFDSFRFKGVSVWYEEVSLPMTADDVVMGFFSGKLGANTLKKCVGAWIYYKFYRGKNGIMKKIACKLCRKMLGGDFDV